MRHVFFITHPEVVVDPGRLVPRWHLADRGIARMRAFAASPEMQAVTSIWSSDETKAMEAAGILSTTLNLPSRIHPDLHENDRGATSFLPPAEFEDLAHQFFATPNASVRGWERAIDAQQRVRAAFEAIIAEETKGDIAIVAHGGVGTLLLCHLLGTPITRAHDQPFQGHYWAYAPENQILLHPWRPIAPR
ncbi:histidine phosphatase family protein [Pleomorphomonas sp. PLEO]|uniref:histidine phosphatase family protein n=1 Tax=Pleomorphomonas sp. PLEO TaxID=3239306 RepID=UPI00351E669B